jgi:hypothetical protein
MTIPPFSRWLAAAFCLLLVSGCSTYRDLRPGRTDVSAGVTTIPAQVIGSHFLIETKWDKHGPWRFLVDTGSTVTLVTREFAQRYGTDSTPGEAPPLRVKSADGDAALLPGTTIKRISLGSARFENVQALVTKLDDLSAHLGVKIDGVLGFPLFRNTVFTLDYPQSRLQIYSRFDAPRPVGSTIKFNNAQRIPLIPVRIGETTLIALIDSGSDGPLLLNPFGLKLKYATEPRAGSAVGTLTGNRTQQIGRLSETVSIGSYQLPRPIVDLTDQLSSIGGEILRNFAVTFDQAHNQVTFSRPSAGPIESPPRRSTGLAFSKGPTYWRVVNVVPGSPADELDIQPGDLVTRVNGESIANWPLQRFEPLSRRATEIVFTFLDGSKEKPVVVPTFELVP